jgi:hypothetical protein
VIRTEVTSVRLSHLEKEMLTALAAHMRRTEADVVRILIQDAVAQYKHVLHPENQKKSQAPITPGDE